MQQNYAIARYESNELIASSKTSSTLMRFQNAPFSSYYKRIVFYASTLAFSSRI